MKQKKGLFNRCISTGTAVVLMIIWCLFAVGMNDARADMGPKPSINLKVVNGPEEYYVALLAHGYRYSPDEETQLSFDSVDNGNIEMLLKHFSDDGWYYHTTPVGDSYYCSNAEGEYRFGYIVPNPFRVIVVGTDGQVYLSEKLEQKEYNAVCTYDVAKGTLTEDRRGNFAERSRKVALYYILTVAVELLVLYFAHFPMSKRNVLSVVIVNALTNIPFTIFLLHSQMGLGILFVWPLLEALIALTEGLIYIEALTHENGVKRRRRNFAYGLVANLISAVAGFAAVLISSMVS